MSIKFESLFFFAADSFNVLVEYRNIPLSISFPLKSTYR